MGSLDAKVSTQIFRKDAPMILASRRDLASLEPVRLAGNVGGYPAGQVLARNSVSGNYQAYNDAGASGINTAVGVLFQPVADEDFTGGSTTGTTMAQMVIGGELYESKLTGLDAAAKVDLGSRSIIDATGTTILKF